MKTALCATCKRNAICEQLAAHRVRYNEGYPNATDCRAFEVKEDDDPCESCRYEDTEIDMETGRFKPPCDGCDLFDAWEPKARGEM